MLEHQGEGSLLSALKTKKLGHYIKSTKRTTARGFSIFNILVDLTEEGIKHIEDIVLMVFQYINMLKLKGPIKRIYDVIDEINYNFM